MKTQKQSVKFVKNDLMMHQPSVSQIYEPKVKSGKNSQPQRTTSQERPQINSLKQETVSVPSLFTDPQATVMGVQVGPRYNQQRFEKTGFEEQRLRRKIDIGRAVGEKNQKFNFSANSKLKQDSQILNDRITIQNSPSQSSRNKSHERNLRPNPTVYSGESCSTLSIKQQTRTQTILRTNTIQSQGYRGKTKMQSYQNYESNLLENNVPIFQNEYQQHKTDFRDLHFAKMNSLSSAQFPDTHQIHSFFDGQINDFQSFKPIRQPLKKGITSIENYQSNGKIDDDQKSQNFTSQSLIERDSNMHRTFDEFVSSSKLPNNFMTSTGYSQGFKYEPKQTKRSTVQCNTFHDNQNQLAFSRAEIRRENSISEILSEEESIFFDAVPMTEPIDHRQFNSEVSSYSKVLESLIGSDSLLGDQNSLNNQESQKMRRYTSAMVQKAKPVRLLHLNSINYLQTPTSKLTDNMNAVESQNKQYEQKTFYRVKLPQDGLYNPKRSDDSFNTLEYGQKINTRQLFEAPIAPKGQNCYNEQAKMLKSETNRLIEQKSEGVKKIVFHKVKIYKKGGKIIKKPYKVVIKKTLIPSGAKKQKLNELKRFSAHNYPDFDPQIQLQKLRRRPIQRELFSREQQTNHTRGSARKQQAYQTQNAQDFEYTHQFYQGSQFCGEQQQNIAQNGQNHIHHHHYYILNQQPLFQSFNLRDGHTESNQIRQSSQFSARSRNNFEYQPDQMSLHSNQGRYYQNNSLRSQSRRYKHTETREQAGWSPRRMISASVCSDYNKNNHLPSVNSSVYGDLNSLSGQEERSQEGSFFNLINQNSKAGPLNQTYRQIANQNTDNSRNSVYNVSSTEKRIQMQPLPKDRSPLVHKRLNKSVSVQKGQKRPLSSQKGGKCPKAKEQDVPVEIVDQDQSSVHSLFCEPFNASRVIRFRPVEDLNENCFERKNSLERDLTRPASPIQFKAPLKGSQVILFEVTKVKNHHNCLYMNPFHRFHMLNPQLKECQTKLEGRKKLDQHNEAFQNQVLNVNRYLKVRRFLEKRQKRIWNTRISYAVRKEVACKRPRVAGKFIKKESHGLIGTYEAKVLNLVTIHPHKSPKKTKNTKEKAPSKLAQPHQALKDKLSKAETNLSPPKGPKDKRKAKKKAKEQKTAVIMPKAAKKKGNKRTGKLQGQFQVSETK